MRTSPSAGGRGQLLQATPSARAGWRSRRTAGILVTSPSNVIDGIASCCSSPRASLGSAAHSNMWLQPISAGAAMQRQHRRAYSHRIGPYTSPEHDGNRVLVVVARVTRSSRIASAQRNSGSTVSTTACAERRRPIINPFGGLANRLQNLRARYVGRFMLFTRCRHPRRQLRPTGQLRVDVFVCRRATLRNGDAMHDRHCHRGGDATITRMASAPSRRIFCPTPTSSKRRDCVTATGRLSFGISAAIGRIRFSITISNGTTRWRRPITHYPIVARNAGPPFGG